MCVAGGDCTFETMDQVREQQEGLARLHFDLDTQLDVQHGYVMSSTPVVHHGSSDHSRVYGV